MSKLTINNYIFKYLNFKFVARGWATAEWLRNALCLLKSCQLLHNCTKNFTWKDLQ